MSFLQSIIFGIIQGFSEFLPISSSGHLNLFQHLFGLKPSLVFDVFLNTATFFSVVFFFRKQVSYFLKNIGFIVVGSIPAALIGFLFKSQFESIFSDPKLLPLFFLITSVFVFSTKYLSNSSQKLDYRKALIIGLFQAIAILPGVSRAGTTIFAGLLVGLSPLEAFNFSFSLFIPASIGALALSLKDMNNNNFLNLNYIISFIITFFAGIIALFLLRKLLINKKLWLFSFYTLAVAIISLSLLFKIL